MNEVRDSIMSHRGLTVILVLAVSLGAVCISKFNSNNLLTTYGSITTDGGKIKITFSESEPGLEIAERISGLI